MAEMIQSKYFTSQKIIHLIVYFVSFHSDGLIVHIAMNIHAVNNAIGWCR